MKKFVIRVQKETFSPLQVRIRPEESEFEGDSILIASIRPLFWSDPFRCDDVALHFHRLEEERCTQAGVPEGLRQRAHEIAIDWQEKVKRELIGAKEHQFTNWNENKEILIEVR